MKKLFFFAVFLSFVVAAADGQTRPAAPVSKAAGKSPQIEVSPASAEISEADWKALAAAMHDEKWDAASALAAQYLQQLKSENAKKQLAQLRYIYLYSLAGKAAEKKMSFTELERTAAAFIGQEFLMVGRQVLADCNTKVNYICAASNGAGRILRVTATNRAGDAIHAFEYIVLDEKFDVRANNEKVAFLGGRLQKVQRAESKADLEILRLVFEKGFIKVATD